MTSRNAAGLTRHNSNSHEGLEPVSQVGVAYPMNKKNHTEVNIGIDTSQTQLDIYVRPCGDYFSVENTPQRCQGSSVSTPIVPTNPGAD